MKRYIKLSIIAVISIILIIGFAYEVQATDLNSMGDLNSYTQSNGDNSKLVDMGNVIVWVVRRMGEAVAVTTLLIVGIKYIMGSIEEKAEYKQTMWPYILGAALIFLGAEITNIIYTAVTAAS